jgi:hypothetical protein
MIKIHFRVGGRANVTDGNSNIKLSNGVFFIFLILEMPLIIMRISGYTDVYFQAWLIMLLTIFTFLRRRTSGNISIDDPLLLQRYYSQWRLTLVVFIILAVGITASLNNILDHAVAGLGLYFSYLSVIGFTILVVVDAIKVTKF